MKRQTPEIATQKSNDFLLAFKNITSATSILDTQECQVQMLASPHQVCALVPKMSCADGHRIELFIVQRSDVTNAQLTDITKVDKVIKLTSIVKEIESFNSTHNQVTFNLIEGCSKEYREIEAVILQRQDDCNDLLMKLRVKNGSEE